MDDSPVAMNVYGSPVTQAQVEAIKSAMSGEFTLAELMQAAANTGLTYRVYYRAIDRLLQRERRAGRIHYKGNGQWSEIATPEAP